MRNRFDQLAKNILRDALSHIGTVETQTEVMEPNAQMVDAWFVPAATRLASGIGLGMLAQIAAEACMIEPFHGAIDLRELRECLRKQLSWHNMLVHRASRDGRDDPPFPALWILCGGRPNTVIKSFVLTVEEGASAGVYTCVPGLRLYLVVLAELPLTRETLLLRLMGAGRTLRDAIAEVMALPVGAWERSVAEPWLISLRFEIPAEASQRTVEEEELLVEIQKWYEELKRGIRQEGKLEELAGFFATRLGRPLSDAEQAVLAERARRLGDERLRSVVLANDSGAVAAWLADPAAS